MFVDGSTAIDGQRLNKHMSCNCSYAGCNQVDSGAMGGLVNHKAMAALADLASTHAAAGTATTKQPQSTASASSSAALAPSNYHAYNVLRNP